LYRFHRIPIEEEAKKTLKDSGDDEEEAINKLTDFTYLKDIRIEIAKLKTPAEDAGDEDGEDEEPEKKKTVCTSQLGLSRKCTNCATYISGEYGRNRLRRKRKRRTAPHPTAMMLVRKTAMALRLVKLLNPAAETLAKIVMTTERSSRPVHTRKRRCTCLF
jgi:hypothetical protein